MTTPDQLLENNRDWAAARRAEDPDFFAELAAGQDPEVFWISCADSRVPPSLITGVEPGNLFVQRNIANLVRTSDANLLSCLEYAVHGLSVDHVIVCGHYGCGGVGACLTGTDLEYVEDWVQEIHRVRRAHADELDSIDDPDDRVDRLSELNVEEQVDNLAETSIVRDAWQEGADLSLHGWMFGLSTGELVDLGITRRS